MKDVLTTSLSTLKSIEKEWIAVVPVEATVLSSLYLLDDDKEFVDSGGKI